MELRREALKGARPTQVLGFFGRQHTPLAALAVQLEHGDLGDTTLCQDGLQGSGGHHASGIVRATSILRREWP